jgi:hypothetical protein
VATHAGAALADDEDRAPALVVTVQAEVAETLNGEQRSADGPHRKKDNQFVEGRAVDDPRKVLAVPKRPGNRLIPASWPTWNGWRTRVEASWGSSVRRSRWTPAP